MPMISVISFVACRIIFLLIDQKDLLVISRWRPPHRSVNRRIQRYPSTFVKHFEIDMGEQFLPLPIEADERKTHWMTYGFKHRSEQDRQVIAIARPQLKHPPRGVK